VQISIAPATTVTPNIDTFNTRRISVLPQQNKVTSKYVVHRNGHKSDNPLPAVGITPTTPVELRHRAPSVVYWWGKLSLEANMKIPGPDHPISIEMSHSHIVISVAGVEIANSRQALLLREASYPPVLYVPRQDTEMTLLQRTEHSTHCPYKGDCAYFSIPVGGAKSVNAVWSYENPYAAVAVIKGHLAFYPNRVDSTTITEDRIESRRS
jgi:uncharacterized protein (DUF427 family)